MAPRPGFKPGTHRLTADHSIAELTRNFSITISALPLSVHPNFKIVKTRYGNSILRRNLQATDGRIVYFLVCCCRVF